MSVKLVSEREAQWKKLSESIKACEKCSLSKQANQPIPGTGPFAARVFFVGEAPGKQEDIQHEPFVGASGKLLDEQLERIGLSRDKVFITNIVKCRPIKIDKNGKKQNRTPTNEERSICSPYLTKQILLARPDIIVTLGRVSGDFYRPRCKMGTSKVIKVKSSELNEEISVIHFAMYHPAYALYNRNNLPLIEKHFNKLRELLQDNEVKINPIKSDKQKKLTDFFKRE